MEPTVAGPDAPSTSNPGWTSVQETSVQETSSQRELLISLEQPLVGARPVVLA